MRSHLTPLRRSLVGGLAIGAAGAGALVGTVAVASLATRRRNADRTVAH